MCNFDRGHLADVPLDEEVQMGEDDEGRSQAGPRVVLNNQVVPLEFPVDVAVLLNFVEGVAVIYTHTHTHTHTQCKDGYSIALIWLMLNMDEIHSPARSRTSGLKIGDPLRDPLCLKYLNCSRFKSLPICCGHYYI